MSYFNYLTEGVEQHQWGYGIHRTTLNADPHSNTFAIRVPYTFTSAGYKDEMGGWFACLHMNADLDSPQKRRPMNKSSNMKQLWFEMMVEFADEYARKNV